MKAIYRYFSPFYDFARRKLHIPWRVVDAHLAAHGTATVNGKNVIIHSSRGEHIAHVGIGHGRHAAKWANQFNSRAGVSNV